jgi:hypothetical protein
MTAFRALLVVMWLIIAVYTTNVVAMHGLNLLPVFFGDMAKMAWPGQFNLDFMFMLTLSGLWVAWRHHFSATGIVLGVLAFSFGAFFLTSYLLVIIPRAKGNMKEVLLGAARAAG